MTHTEPRPRHDGRRVATPLPARGTPIALPAPDALPAHAFADVLAMRTSSVRGPASPREVATLLHHASALRFRRHDGRFGDWESRPSPSAGGLHAIRLLVLPLEAGFPAGIHEPERHELRSFDRKIEALEANRRSVTTLTGANHGTTLQLLADEADYEACYADSETLSSRDAGALCMTLSLVATAIGLGSVILGRLGHEVVRAAGIRGAWRGAGAVHVTGRLQSPEHAPTRSSQSASTS